MAGRVQSMNYRDGRSTPYFNRYSSILGYRGVYIGLTPRCITIGMFWTGKLDLACIIYSVLSTMLSSVPDLFIVPIAATTFRNQYGRADALQSWYYGSWQFGDFLQQPLAVIGCDVLVVFLLVLVCNGS